MIITGGVFYVFSSGHTVWGCVELPLGNIISGKH